MAHEGSQGPCSQLGVAEDFEWKGQNHEEIGDDGVLKENDEVGFTADLKEHPHGQAVGDESHEKQHGVEEREERLGDLVVPAALAAVPSHGAEVVHGATWRGGGRGGRQAPAVPRCPRLRGGRFRRGRSEKTTLPDPHGAVSKEHRKTKSRYFVAAGTLFA